MLQDTEMSVEAMQRLSLHGEGAEHAGGGAQKRRGRQQENKRAADQEGSSAPVRNV